MKYIFIFLYITLTWLWVIIVNLINFIYFLDFKHKQSYKHLFLTIQDIKKEITEKNLYYKEYLNFVEKLLYESLK